MLKALVLLSVHKLTRGKAMVCFLSPLFFVLFAGAVSADTPGTLKWSYTTGNAVRSSPAIAADGTIYVGSNDRNLYAINPNGSLKWAYAVGNSLNDTSPAIAADGTVYVGGYDLYTSNRRFYAINPDGTLKWYYTLGGGVRGSPSIATDGTIYVGCDDNQLYAINPDGTLQWSYKFGIASSPSIAADGTIYAGSLYPTDRLNAINPDGTLKWYYTVGSDSDVHTTPAIGSDGTIYVGAYDISLPDSRFFAINPDGTQKWVYKADGEIYSSPAIGADGTIYFGTFNNNPKLYAINPDGTLKWSYTIGTRIQSSPAVGRDGVVYVGSNDNKFYAINPDGTLKWSYTTGGTVWSSPVIAPDGTVYVGSGDKKLYALNSTSLGLAASSWPMFLQDAMHDGNISAVGPTPAGGSLVPLYRLYRGGSAKDHFYTTSITERDQKVAEGYAYEGVEGFVSDSPFDGSKALGAFYIYAQQAEWTSPLFHASLDTDNFYTTSKYEYQHAIATWGFTDGGIAGYVATRIANNRPQGNFAGVGMAVGNLTLPSFTDLSLNGVGPQLSFTRYYDSRSPGTTLGQGWSFSYDSYILEDANGIHVQWGNGSESHFFSNLTPYPGYFEKAAKVNDGSNYGYDITTKDQTEYQFRRLSLVYPGPDILLIKIIDKHLNTLTLDREGSYGVVMSATDATGRVFNYEYTPVPISDGRTVQRLTKVTDTSLTPNRTVNLAYDAQGNLASVTDARGNTTSYTYNPVDGLLTRITYPEGNTVDVTYNDLLQVTGYTNGSIFLSFDYQGGMVGTTVRSGTDTLVNVVPDVQWRAGKVTFAGNTSDNTQSTYCTGALLNLPCDVKDRNGNKSYFTYGANGNLLTVTNALNETTTYTYDPQNKNNVTSITDPRGNTTTFTYDANYRNLLSVRKPLGGTTTYQYPSENDRGLVESITDPTGHSITYIYDAQGNVTKINDNALSTSIDFINDDAGRRKTKTDQARPTPQLTAWEYDNNDNVISMQVASSPAATFNYDKNNRLTSVLDQRGKATTYTYNTMNLLATQQSPDLKTWQYAYDSVGNLSSVTLPDGNSVTYGYDANKRLQYVRYNGAEKLFYTYDNNGNILSVRVDGDSGRTTSFIYNAANRVTSVTDQFGKAVGYGYDAAGNRTSITYPESKIVNYTFDADNRLSTVRDWLGSATTTYNYNSAGILQSVTNTNGTTVTYGYDQANRLTSLVNRQANNNGIADYTLTLDNVGNPTSITGNEPSARPVPTAVDVSYSYNDANQIQSAGTVTYTHDGLGNLSGATNGRSFSFDYANRLTNATIGSDNFAYLYDGLGNRISRTRNGAQTRYLLDLNADMSNVLAETDAGGTVQNYYVHGLRLLSRINAAGQRFTFHYDTNGNTAAVTDDSGTVSESYAYNEFGATVAANPPNSTNPFRYVGKYGVMDEGNGLLFMRARYYDTDMGRFISRDPIEFEGEDLNLYAYVKGNPLAHSDPEGTISLNPLGAFASALIESPWIVYNSTQQTLYTYESVKAYFEGDYAYSKQVGELAGQSANRVFSSFGNIVVGAVTPNRGSETATKLFGKTGILKLIDMRTMRGIVLKVLWALGENKIKDMLKEKLEDMSLERIRR